jgi:hypothetical protein
MDTVQGAFARLIIDPRARHPAAVRCFNPNAQKQSSRTTTNPSLQVENPYVFQFFRGEAVVRSEAESFWSSFLRDLARRKAFKRVDAIKKQ